MLVSMAAQVAAVAIGRAIHTPIPFSIARIKKRKLEWICPNKLDTRSLEHKYLFQ